MEMLRVLNIEKGNYYIKCTFIIIIYCLLFIFRSIYKHVFTKLFKSTQVSEDVQFQVSGSRNNTQPDSLILARHGLVSPSQ